MLEKKRPSKISLRRERRRKINKNSKMDKSQRKKRISDQANSTQSVHRPVQGRGRGIKLITKGETEKEGRTSAEKKEYRTVVDRLLSLQTEQKKARESGVIARKTQRKALKTGKKENPRPHPRRGIQRGTRIVQQSYFAER